MHKKLISAAIMSAALGTAGQANAASFVTMNGASATISGTTGCATGVKVCSFTDTLTFTTPSGFETVSALLGSVASSVATNIDFSAIVLNGVSFVLSRTGGFENAAGTNMTLAAGGLNTLTISGTTGSDAAYSGTLSFAAATVPEPATWAMLLVGFGMIGAAARYRRRGMAVSFA